MDNMPPKYMRKRDMSPEQLQAKLEAKRKYHREWAKAHQNERWARMKERMAADPEYKAEYLRKAAEASAKRRQNPKNETPDDRERRLKRQREYKAKRYREWRLANPIVPKEPKPPKEKKPKSVPSASFKKKPGRLLVLSGWRGF